ncbi:c-type cytochrome [Flavihumibacter petaseus]|uniref:Putative cytochrome c n=1 Tax=Flavihumibacter petaseus NBRC 106054 TaxID=1220578 RepID=A0A0E9MXG1_9BACT|nr:c-type cytochrome [Flavihumibacter petaseus]GAO42193.1 putative cytochrome c [Flavihumibacter petaseus NBRC 106054]
MISYRSVVKRAVFSVLLLAVVSLGQNVFAQDGKALFMEKCASCHSVTKTLTGPALKGIDERVPDKKLLHAWIRNNQAVLATGNKYFNDLYLANNKTPMNLFPDLTDGEIDAILAFVKTEGDKPVVAATPGGDSPADKAQSSDSTLLYGILTLILAIIVFTLLQVNANLKKLSDDKEGVPAHEPVPFWRNKAYIALFAVILFIVGGYYTIQGAIGLGRNKDYQPEQPIYYSHKVHAGTNQISCLYCHGGAQDGRHANIPSLNICMNCHMAINEYTGTEKLYREDGTEVHGTTEIQKIYSYTGWDPAQKKYANEPKPIEWVKIHNLPDHVYFNHSQHVVAGKVACQTCHGDIQNMGEVKQFSDLSMGWCINCHRETKVQFNDNKFYSIYEKFHDDLKSGKLDSVTVERIGGTECQKCHY